MRLSKHYIEHACKMSIWLFEMMHWRTLTLTLPVVTKRLLFVAPCAHPAEDGRLLIIGVGGPRRLLATNYS
jgi:hypothetical protein